MNNLIYTSVYHCLRVVLVNYYSGTGKALPASLSAESTDHSNVAEDTHLLIFVMAALCNRGPLYFSPVVSFFYLLLLFFLA